MLPNFIFKAASVCNVRASYDVVNVRQGGEFIANTVIFFYVSAPVTVFGTEENIRY